MLRLIVHADDFGLSEAINDGILRSHREGILTATSLMANGDAFDHAVELCRRSPALDVGVHLTLVEERPLLDPDAVSSLVGADGRFHRHATVLARRYFSGRLCLDQVRKELDAQIRLVLSRGIRPTHLDSHQHAHMLPHLLRVVTELAREHDIPHVRYPAEKPTWYMVTTPYRARRALELLGMSALCLFGRRAPVRRTDHFVGFYFGGDLGTHNLRLIINSLPRTGTCELMCHPGLPDPETRHAHWGYHWQEEFEALVDPAIAVLIRSRDIALISFRDLQ